MIDVEQLVRPVSPDDSCGADLSYDPEVQELEVLFQGKPETQFSAAEEPEWDDLRARCIGLLQRTKNLRIGVILCLALLQTNGITGFRDGLRLILRLLQAYWSELYPRIDPDDDNDPTERVNILAALATPLGTFDDPMQFIQRLRQTKLSNSPRIGRFSFDDLSTADGGSDTAQITASFHDTNPDHLHAVDKALADSIATVDEIDAFLTRTIGAASALDWAPLLSILKEMRKALAVYTASTSECDTAGGHNGENIPAEEAEVGNSRLPMANVSVAVPGVIQSREDVVRTIDRLCEYYRRAEPSSPVPLLLRRAQRLATKSFLEIIEDLSPEALGPLYHVTGTTPSPSSES